MENNELLKEINRLQGLLAKHGICEDCGELYNHHGDEPFASCGCKQSEWYELTPHMLQVQGLKAERDALAAHNSTYAKTYFRFQELCDELIDHLRYNKREDSEVLDDFWSKLDAISLPNSPQQCLRDVQAEAVWSGYVEGRSEEAMIRLGSIDIGDYAATIENAANEHAAKVRKGGAE